MSLKTESLASMCEAVVDCPHSTPVWTKSGYVVLRNQNIKDGRLDLSDPSFTDEDHFKQRIRRMAPRPGDIVITREAPMGEVCKIPEGLTCCLGQRQVLLRPKADVDTDYLLYALQSPFVQNQIRWNEGTGSTVSNIRIPVLEKIEIPRHDQAETNIAKALGSLDSKIDLNRRINQTLEAMAQAIFKSWFVDFDPVKAKIAAIEQGQDPLRAAMRAISGKTDAELDQMPREHHDQLAATAALFPDEMEDVAQGSANAASAGGVSALGGIPRGWRIATVSEFAVLIGGKQLEKEHITSDGYFPVFGGAGVMGYTENYNADGFVISVGRVGAYCGQFFSHRGKAWINNNASLIQQKDEKLGEWLFISLRHAEIDTIKKGAAQPFVSNGDIAKLPLLWPGEEVTSAFTKHISLIFRYKEANDQQSQTLIKIRDTLLPKLLSGELSVEDIPVEVAH